MSFPRYPKYKDSGVEWLGQVPEHWEVKRLRFATELNPSKSEVAKLDRETPVSFLPMEAIGDDGTLSLENEKTIGELESGYTYFRDGDVIVAKITPCYENGKGALMRGLRNGIGFGTTELIVARPKADQVTGTYLHYLFISPDFRSIGQSHMYGAGGQKRVPDAFVRNFATAFPPVAEQTAIAAFLDRETGKIDGLVAEQRRLMELLKEKRQAVISHAVTKGLNPHAPLKPSGIEWLGEVPEHWEVVGMTKYLSSLVDYRGRTPPKVDEGVFLLTARNIRDGKVDYTTSEEFIPESEYEDVMRRGKPEVGDVLFTTEAPLGQVANMDRTDVALAQRVLKFRGQAGILDNYFLKYWLMGSFAQADMEQLATGSTALGIKGSKVVQLRLCLPPNDEQRAIVIFLDAELSKFDTLTTEAQRAIDLLQERRTALISAAVTGQIDVRPLTGKQPA
jgi:type I restriction enzyme S subunit